MKGDHLRKMIFWALCCGLGLFCKRLVAPIANVITAWLHIPGGIGTSFSLMFLALAGSLAPSTFCCTKMSFVQSMLALALGMVGNMGILSPLGYVMPGLVMDGIFKLGHQFNLRAADTFILANSLGAIAAALTANLIVFHLRGMILLVYVCVAALSGALFGLLGSILARKLRPAITSHPANKEN